jgi:gamma-glutamylcyclotransferase (GGCT)/AIG2-like uncharacterized protein YtfP
MGQAVMPGFVPVFVYGTLKPGEVNDWVYRHYSVVAVPAIAFGALYHLRLGYPALTLGRDRVQGMLLTFGYTEGKAPILEVLDQFEQHDPISLRRCVPDCRLVDYHYQRQWIDVFDPVGTPLSQAWAYTMPLAQVRSLASRRIESGIWRSDDPENNYDA